MLMLPCGTGKQTIEDRATQPLNWKAEFCKKSRTLPIWLRVVKPVQD